MQHNINYFQWWDFVNDLGVYCTKEISEHIYDGEPDSIEFEGNFAVFTLINFDKYKFRLVWLKTKCIVMIFAGTGSISSGSAKSVHSTSIPARADSRLEDSLNESTISTLSTSYPRLNSPTTMNPSIIARPLSPVSVNGTSFHNRKV